MSTVSFCISGGLQITHSQPLDEVQSSPHTLNRAWSCKPSFLQKMFLSRETHLIKTYRDIPEWVQPRAMKMRKGLDHLAWKRQKVGNAQPRGETLSICLCTQRDIIKSTSNSVMAHDRTKVKGHKLKYRQFQLVIRKLFYSEGGQALLAGFQQNMQSSSLGILKTLLDMALKKQTQL